MAAAVAMGQLLPSRSYTTVSDREQASTLGLLGAAFWRESPLEALASVCVLALLIVAATAAHLRADRI